jgi:hypothetical protein
MYKVCARCGGGAIHWASLGPFAVDTCYHISVFMIGFTASINTHRWLLGCPLAHLLLLHLALTALTLSVFAMLTAFLAYSMKAMARCSPLSKNAAANVANVENQDATGHPVETARIVSEGEAPGAPNNDGHALSARGTEDSMDGGASDDENSQTYYFGASTITLSKINKMVEMGYFVEGEAQSDWAETVPEPNNDKAISYEDFFIAGLRMPLHTTLGGILLQLQAKLHQLTPIAIAQMSK